MESTYVAVSHHIIWALMCTVNPIIQYMRSILRHKEYVLFDVEP